VVRKKKTANTASKKPVASKSTGTKTKSKK